MKSLHFTTIIQQEGEYFVSRCTELGVVSQGKTIDEAQKNLREAIDLYLEDAPEEVVAQAQQHPFVTTLDVEYA
ncbi:MAG: type II toxin-antitoxin system HicB family antitoxin [bacterium]|nr:type II toxin-antitoxin system HicB family antitoxin [bacterium]